MTYAEASKLRDEIKTKADWDCVVPRGRGHAPDGYFARIYSTTATAPLQAVDFYSRAEYRTYRAMRLRQRRKRLRELANPPRRLSPLEMMIDRACGLS